MSESHEAIRNLLRRYCALMDAADWAGVGELFAEAALIGPNGEIAEAIAYLSSHAARSITGTTLVVDGGTQS